METKLLHRSPYEGISASHSHEVAIRAYCHAYSARCTSSQAHSPLSAINPALAAILQNLASSICRHSAHRSLSSNSSVPISARHCSQSTPAPFTPRGVRSAGPPARPPPRCVLVNSISNRCDTSSPARCTVQTPISIRFWETDYKFWGPTGGDRLSSSRTWGVAYDMTLTLELPRVGDGGHRKL